MNPAVHRAASPYRGRLAVETIEHIEILAIQAGLDKVALGLLDGHSRHCMHQGAAEGRAEQMATGMMAAVGRLMKRG